MNFKKIVAVSVMISMLFSHAVFAQDVTKETKGEDVAVEGTDDESISPEEIDTLETEVIDETIDEEVVVEPDEGVEESDVETEEEIPEDEPEEVEKNYTLLYRVHVQTYGWQDWVQNGEEAGTTGLSKRLEAIEIRVVDENGNQAEDLHVEYRTHVQTYGWQDWVSDGATSGTEGESKRLEAIQIRLIGEDSEKYTIEYQAHAQTYGWLGYVEEESCAGTAGMSKRLETLRVVLRKIEEPSLVDGMKGYIRTYNDDEFYISGHIQHIGDVTGIVNGGTVGTVGNSLRIEGITIHLDDSSTEVPQGNIEYSTHVQNYGWLSTVTDGTYSGTKNESKRVEAIKINLTGELAEYYDIYYRAHVQKFGWLGWAKNGQAAGSAGYSYRMEAVQIMLVLKGATVPGANQNYFKDGNNAIEKIKSYAGCPYKYGGTTPNGWDCSGCMQWLYENIFGVSIPRTSREQARYGTSVSISNMSQWKPGDLIFFGSSSVSHVAMYIGDGYMIHALNSKAGTRIDSVKWFDTADKTTVMMAVRRIL